MFGNMLAAVRQTGPLVHAVTNFVTANDCANILLACGASPIMACDPEEAEDITSICSGLCLNMGTLQRRTADAMLLAGKRANALGHPVVLDPVGAGASRFRTETALQLLREIRFAVIRGNISEMKTLAFGGSCPRGVDADASDRVTEASLHEAISFARSFSAETGSVIAITGSIDIVAGDSRAYCIRNGHPMMSSVTGSGCQLSALTAAFVSANPDQPLAATAAAVAAMGLAGEIAFGRMGAADGNAAYRGYITDAIFRMTPEQLEKGAKYEMR